MSATTAASIPAKELLRAEPDLVPARGRRRAGALHRMLAIADVCGALAAATLGARAAGLEVGDAFVVGLTGALVLPLLAFVCGLYAADGLRAWATGVGEVRRMSFATLALSWPLYGAAWLQDVAHPALVTALATPLTFALVTCGRAIARTVAHRSPRLQERVAIVGSGVVAGELVEVLRLHGEFGLVPVGIVENAEDHRAVGDLPLLGPLDDLARIIERDAIDRVIIAFSRAGHPELLKAIRACRDNRVPVHVVPRLFEFLDGARALDHIGGLPLVSLGVPRLTRAARLAKRALDVAGATIGLIACLPLFAGIAVAIKLGSPGPVFFRQVRGGRRGRTFELTKFRSMYEHADARKEGLLVANEMPGGVMFKIRQDPRITPVGRWLRRFSLDELPQLWNVLRGEMSLVGPRPLVLNETEWIAEEWQARRSELRPGLTGPWQVYGRSEVPFESMLRLDYQYVCGWSLARDVEILCSTVPAVVGGRGAY